MFESHTAWRCLQQFCWRFFFKLLLEEGNRLAAAFKEMLDLVASQLTWKSHVMPLSQGDKRLWKNMIKQHVNSIIHYPQFSDPCTGAKYCRDVVWSSGLLAESFPPTTTLFFNWGKRWGFNSITVYSFVARLWQRHLTLGSERILWNSMPQHTIATLEWLKILPCSRAFLLLFLELA